MPENTQKLSGNEIRDIFLNFFAQRGHQILPSASLVPEDPTVLLTIAGMLPFKPIFLGQRTAEFNRATTSQKCIRTNDIENVGRTKRHHTFFEMLGNFSFGDYFKPQAIAWGWELSTQVFGLPPEKLVVSVFEDDDEAYNIWRDDIGVPEARIKRMGEDDNFWVSGHTGPCGPCSEIYYDFHPELGDENIDLEDDTRFIEFYNLVFMQYNRDAEGNLTPLQNKNIDTGMGLERMAQILQQVPNNYETDLIFPIIETAAEIAGIDYHKSDETTKVSLKVIGDHVRSVVQMIADEIRASNVGRGYVLRRLIRRVVRHGRLLGINSEFITQVAETAISLSESAYPNV
ncbi:alanine--tRNA ligase, partial [Nodularia spumigena CS-590/02]